MLEVKINGIYETDIGTNQKQYHSFEYTYKTARVSPVGLFTHALRRHAPYLISKDKKNNKAVFSRIKSLVISDIQKLDEPCYLQGKDINKLNDWEIQDFACLFDLYDIPLHGVVSLPELREKAILSYLEHVLKVPMATPQEKSKLAFFEQQEDNTYKFVLGENEVTINVDENALVKKVKKEEKKDINYFIKKTGRVVADGILNLTGNQVAEEGEKDSDENNDGMPSAEDLLQ